MARFLVLLCFVLFAAATISHAALPPVLYWKSVLPDTPIPGAISDLLTGASPTADQKTGGTSVNFGKGGVYVDAGKGKPGGTTVGVGKGGVGVNAGNGGTTVGVGKGGVYVDAGKGKPGGTTVGVGKGGVGVYAGKGTPGGTIVGVGKGGVSVDAGKGKPGHTNVNVGHGGVGVNVGPKYGKPPVTVRVQPGSNFFLYKYAATATQIHDDPNAALFFLENDLRAENRIAVHFVKTSSGAVFLPRTTASSIPFSSEKLPEIERLFQVKPDSAEADAMKQTLGDCEGPAAKGEKKLCVTSLESMVDFATSSLGTRRVDAVSTTVVGKEATPKQQYEITGVRALATGGGDSVVACHAQTYAYAVFNCHLARATRAYEVGLAGADGTAVSAVAVCHTDTTAWNPRHVAFQVLKVQPGTVPVCHFLPEDHVVWTAAGAECQSM